MSIAAATAHATGHAAIVAVAAATLATPVAGLLRRARGTRWAWPAWAMLLSLLLTPALLLGYAYATVSLSLVRLPWLNEALYVALMAARFVPVAALVVYFSPPPTLSAEARFCAAMLPGGSRQRVVTARAWLVHGPGRRLVVAAGAAFLLAFQEFEVASLMGVSTWTVWLFDQQAGGLPLTTTLAHAAAPLAVELAVLAPLAAVLLTQPREAGVAEHPAERRGAASMAAAWLIGSFAAAAAYPLITVAWEVGAEPGALAGGGRVLAQVRVSLGYAAAAVAIVLLVIAASRRLRLARFVLCLPGLLGSLVLALAMVTLFQRAPLHALYDTPAPWTVTLALLLMPLATLLALLIAAVRRHEALHLSALMRSAPEPGVRGAGRRIAWALRGRPWFWAAALLMMVAYFDLAAGALLAPSGDTPVTVTLYNLMHYGHNAVLSAMTLAAVLALLATLGLARVAAGVLPSIPQARSDAASPSRLEEE